MRVHIDFETRSRAELPTAGAWVYASDPSTVILSCAYAIDDGPIHHLTGKQIHSQSPQLDHLMWYAQNPEVQFAAHNAFFEQSIWYWVLHKLLRYPYIPIQRWVCTLAKCSVLSIPSALEQAPQALGLDIAKDTSGKKVMLQMTKPRQVTLRHGGRVWDNNQESFETLYEYNKTDVEVERALDHLVPDLHPLEQQVWFMDQDINFRGVEVDKTVARRALVFIDRYRETMQSRIADVTDGQVKKGTQTAAIKTWLASEGVYLPDLTKYTVEQALSNAGIPDNCKQVLQIRQATGKTSVKKFESVIKGSGPFTRLREILHYYAASTGRWGGRRFQPQNLPRGAKQYNSDQVIHDILTLDYMTFRLTYPNVLEALSAAVRGLILAAPGMRLLVADYSAIEARVLPWLAGQQDTLDVFREGQDIYCHDARNIYNHEVTKNDGDKRQVGKVSTLALGYQGGINAYYTMAKTYAVNLDPVFDILWPTANEEEQRKAYEAYQRYYAKADEFDRLNEKGGLVADVIKQRWRKANPQVVKFWYTLEEAAIQAVLTGTTQYAGKVSFFVTYLGPEQTFAQKVLWCRLPSGRCLAYHKPSLETTTTPWGAEKYKLSYWGMKTSPKGGRSYSKQSAYGGRFAENITQAVARDIMVHAALRLNYSGYPIILNVHDELVSEVPETGQQTLAEFIRVMETPPEWASDLPIAVSGWEGYRYRKD